MRFAAERTLLAWIRTGLAMMGFGFVVARFGLFMREIFAVRGIVAEQPGLSKWVGTALVVLGVLVNLAAAVQYRQRLRLLGRGETLSDDRQSLATAVPMVLSVLGVAMAVYLLRAS